MSQPGIPDSLPQSVFTLSKQIVTLVKQALHLIIYQMHQACGKFRLSFLPLGTPYSFPLPFQMLPFKILFKANSTPKTCPSHSILSSLNSQSTCLYYTLSYVMLYYLIHICLVFLCRF